MDKRVPYIGIVTCIFYLLSVCLFLITKTEIALTLWEFFTVIGAPVILLVLIFLAEIMDIASIYRNIMLVFMACTCSLTGLAHVVNIAVTRTLIAQGVNVPTYFRIGYWPSVEMAIDYLAWGFFMGLAFLSVGCAIRNNQKGKNIVKITVIACGLLCLIGFLGALFINESIWYLAPIGYGLGTIVICVQILRLKLT